MYIQTKEPGAVSLWAFCILLFCCGQIEGVRSRGVENLLPDFCKRKSSPSILESEPCKAKMVTVSVEFRRWKFSPTVSPTKSRFRDKKIPKVTSKYTKALLWNYQIAIKFHKKNGIPQWELYKFWVQVLAGPQNGIRHLLTFLCAGTRRLSKAPPGLYLRRFASPPCSSPDWQQKRAPRWVLFFVMGQPGLEPGTKRLWERR